MRIAYCGYDFFYGCLKELVSRGHEIVEVFTWPTDNEYDFNDNILRIAQEQKSRISLSPINQSDLTRLATQGVEIIVSAAYPYLIPDWKGYVDYAINVHPSPLPVGRGPWPLPWLILKKLKRSSIAVHEVDASFDTGAIVAQKFFDILDYETLESLSIRSQIIARSLLANTIDDIEKCWANRQIQGTGEYWSMPTRNDRTIEFDMGIDQIDRIVRAFSKFEAFAMIDGERHLIRSVVCWSENHGVKPGTLLHRTNKEMVYAAKDGVVCISHWQKG